MTTHADRLRAVRSLAQATGKHPREIVRTAWPDLNPFQRAALEQEAAQAGPPAKEPSAEDQAWRASEAVKARAERERAHDRAALDAWLTFSAANPFEAARIRLRVGAATLDRGRQLAEASTPPDPEPPQAA